MPAYRRGLLRCMDAAKEPAGTYLRRVPRWWAGKGLAARAQINCSAPLSLARERALAQGTNPPISRSASDACVASQRAQTPAASALN
ncbi:hypothetical protein FPL04_03270 [Xanthomonas arboricola]|nr:hypothetical protein FPL04_03270 [Xanthomonas arboricola]